MKLVQGAWFERKFQFDLPVELLPNLRARLRGTPARLEDLLPAHSPEILTAKCDGKWSAQEQAGHLLDLESLWLTRVEDYTAGGQLSPADLTNRRTEEANHNARALAEILAGFRTARQRLMQRTAELPVALYEHSLPHPRLQTPMRLIDHLYFVAEHDDHHLARIWELLNP